MAAPSTTSATRFIGNVILPAISPDDIDETPSSSKPQTFDITIENHCISSIQPTSASGTPTSPTAPTSLLLPTLTHPHIHLDKPYLLTSHNIHDNHGSPLPNYADLCPQSGTFSEALSSTASAKSRFTPPDLLLRGRQLLATSYTQGVTSARCFVEVDGTVGRKTVDVGLKLQGEWRGLVGVQLCVFAQDPVFSGEIGGVNRRWVEEVLREECGKGGGEAERRRDEFGGIRVLGSTPYVEDSKENAIRNIEWAVKTALKYDLHLDFHLDYNLDASKDAEELLVWEVLRRLKQEGWPTTTTLGKRRTVVLGHCSALTLLSHEHLTRLAKEIKEASLPVYFVGLPTSDLYMMGRPPDLPPAMTSLESSTTEQDKIQPMSRLRGTLNIPLLRRLYGIKGVIGVNNVGNAFTPYGTGDPLELASWCVGMMQDGTEMGVRVLFEGISVGARRALGIEAEQEKNVETEDLSTKDDVDGSSSQEVKAAGWLRLGDVIQRLGMLLIRNENTIGLSSDIGELSRMKVPARQRWSVRDVVWDVPRVELRSVLR
ncbi:uncharacterized protein AB675_8264 [Cyphellophora attinorum]|uniref:Metallo-dependent hydrolase n=1 Tax=Cyphellophora attinorum TaxID=1664694 RepID=A0A0N0NQX3_9EURO|nr:uncharacterized protein AB675_8264 [Phialophora attinorum]KPI44418.1 hypothetical protein AB675_8264 [Phialophora attinorum]